MNIVETPPKSLAADLIARFVAIVGEKHAITDPQAQAPYLLEMRDMFRGHTPWCCAGLGRGGRRHPRARQRDRDADRAPGRQYRAGRRADPAARRDRSLPQPPRPHPRGRSRLQHHDLRGRRDPAARARGGRRRGPALSAAPAVGGHLHHRWRLSPMPAAARARPRHRALARARRRGRARRRTRAARSQQAQEGQYRLRSPQPVHRRRGALGVITAAVLRLVPRPRSLETAFVGVPSPQAALELLGLATERTPAA